MLETPCLPQNWRVENQGNRLLLHTELGKPFEINFSKLRALKPCQPLARAIGCKKYQNVLDITAGFGEDAYLLASSGLRVTAVERNELVFSFLQFSKKHLLKDLNLNFILDNSFNYLKNMKEKVEVIYMDPMFPKNSKRASPKALQILQRITTSNRDTHQELLNLAREKSSGRVVVKRHRKDQALEGPLQGSLQGRSIVFDIFKPNL